MSRKKTVVLSLGGSIIIPARVNVRFLKKFRSLILSLTKKGYRFIIVTGGGDTARHYQAGAQKISKISHTDLDWVGIAATKINAELIRSIFGKHAYEKVITNPTRTVNTRKNILVGCGWQPGYSSDKDAALLAKTYGASQVINMSNIRYVYTADPHKNKEAKPIKQMSWATLLALTGTRWKPGAHIPFDPEASKVALKNGISVVVCLGTDLANIRNIITGKAYRGTTIT